MGVREYDYIRGNTALAPERKVKEQSRKTNVRKKAIKANKRRQNIIFTGLKFCVGTFILCCITLYLYGKVYSVQKELLTLEKNIKEQEDINAAIHVDMLKFASFDKIKSTAENELGMIYPSSESTINIDMSKEYFSHLKEEKSKKSSLLQKIISAFN